MAQRSSGIFPREGYNLDDANKATGAATEIASELQHCKTVRIIAFGLGDTTSVDVEGYEVIAAEVGAADPKIVHVRGALLPAGKTVNITNPGSAAVYFEKVD